MGNIPSSNYDCKYKNRNVGIVCNNQRFNDLHEWSYENRPCYMGRYYYTAKSDMYKLPAAVHIFPGYCYACFHKKKANQSLISHFIESMDGKERIQSLVSGFTRPFTEQYIFPASISEILISFIGAMQIKSNAEIGSEHKEIICLDCKQCGCTYYTIDMSYDRRRDLCDER
eukprot:500109_1